MKSLSSFLISFCTVCVLLGAVGILVPDGKMRSSVKFAIALCTICCFSGLFFVSFDIKTVTDNNKVQIESEIGEKATKAVFKKALESENIKYSDIEIFTDKNADGNIIITKVLIYSDDSKDKILKCIGSSENYEVEIINE